MVPPKGKDSKKKLCQCQRPVHPEIVPSLVIIKDVSTHIYGVLLAFQTSAFVICSDFGGFCAVIRLSHLLEPGMIQGLFSRYPVRWVVYKDLLQKVEEVLEEGIVRWNDILFCFLISIDKIVHLKRSNPTYI